MPSQTTKPAPTGPSTTEHTQSGTPDAEAGDVRGRGLRIVWALLRLAVGWEFLWALLDKAFGLGFATGKDPATNAITFFGENQAWLSGGSPTKGFLVYGIKGPAAKRSSHSEAAQPAQAPRRCAPRTPGSTTC